MAEKVFPNLGLATKPAPALTGLLVVLFAGGCAGAPDMTPLMTSAISPSTAVSPLEAYARVARGANKCWFGPLGRYRTTHVLYAEAPPGKGAEIVVHERDHAAERPWGARAMIVRIANVAGSAQVDAENLRMPDADAAHMRAEIARWATGDLTCDIGNVAPAPQPLATAPLPKN
jgi:hypothetical protein